MWFFTMLLLILMNMFSCDDAEIAPANTIHVPSQNQPFKKLSEYNLFQYPFNQLQPVNGVLSYQLNTPLFSDYAEKARFVYVPDGEKIVYDADEVFNFPVGSILVKNFYYGNEDQKNLIETRLLIHYEDGWIGFPYVWDNDQKDAQLVIGGADKILQRPDMDGETFLYKVPNQNQCKGCHAFNNKLVPIGPKAGNLNRVVKANGESINQLDYWISKRILDGLESSGQANAFAIWDDPTSGTLVERARTYLDVNCSHCHRPEGAANNTGLFLNLLETNKTRLGFCKFPVAAGQGSGGRKYDIVPGKPDESILMYRVETVEPASKMPEIGRQLIHKEGVELLRDWIQSLEEEPCN